MICYPKDNPNWEFWATVTDYFEERKKYLVEDQDSDFFEFEEDELSDEP